MTPNYTFPLVLLALCAYLSLAAPGRDILACHQDPSSDPTPIAENTSIFSTPLTSESGPYNSTVPTPLAVCTDQPNDTQSHKTPFVSVIGSVTGVLGVLTTCIKFVSQYSLSCDLAWVERTETRTIPALRIVLGGVDDFRQEFTRCTNEISHAIDHIGFLDILFSPILTYRNVLSTYREYSKLRYLVWGVQAIAMGPRDPTVDENRQERQVEGLRDANQRKTWVVIPLL